MKTLTIATLTFALFTTAASARHVPEHFAPSSHSAPSGHSVRSTSHRRVVVIRKPIQKRGSGFVGHPVPVRPIRPHAEPLPYKGEHFAGAGSYM